MNYQHDAVLQGRSCVCPSGVNLGASAPVFRSGGAALQGSRLPRPRRPVHRATLQGARSCTALSHGLPYTVRGLY